MSATTSTAIAQRRTERSCRLVQWIPWPFPNPSLIGHCSIAFSGGWFVHQVPVFRGKDGLNIGVPNTPQLGADGRVRTRDGKCVYTSVLTFETSEAHERWQLMVLGALAEGGITAGEGGAVIWTVTPGPSRLTSVISSRPCHHRHIWRKPQP